MHAQMISLANMQRRPLTDEEIQAADRLREIWDRRAKDLNLTQEKAAHALGFKNQSAVSQYLNGRVPLSAKALAGLSRLLEVTPEDISKPLADQWFLTRHAPATPEPACPAPTEWEKRASADESQDAVLRQIKRLSGRVTPRSRETLLRLEKLAMEGKLTDDDWAIIDSIAARFGEDST